MKIKISPRRADKARLFAPSSATTVRWMQSENGYADERPFARATTNVDLSRRNPTSLTAMESEAKAVSPR